ncbi:MAG: S8/S53 family peptidase, partial [Pikeienuella sp.]
MDDLIRDLGPSEAETDWREAAEVLAASDTTIAHIDTGLFPHPSLGYIGDTPPANIQLDRGMNVYDPSPTDSRPITDLSKSGGLVAGASEYPDHGVKTMSVILSNNEHLRGVAPGAKLIPYRIANGPVFLEDAKTSNIGRALEHALALPTPPKVVSISMGNPGATGPFELLRFITGGSPGMAKRT